MTEDGSPQPQPQPPEPGVGGPSPDPGAAGTSPEPGAGEIDAYLRQHATRYTHQALDAQLRAAGHSDEAIAAAWRRVQGSAAWSGPQPLPPAGAAGFLYILGVIGIVFVYGASALLGGFGTLVFAGGGMFGDGSSPYSALVLILYTVAVIVAMIVAFRFLTRVDRRRKGVLPMLGAIGIVAAVYVGLCGLCFGGLALSSNLAS